MKTKKMTVEGHSACTTTVTPPAKKMKQARLPFQVLAASPADSAPSPLCKSVKKKRKLSENSDDAKVVKILRSSPNGTNKCESKENLRGSKQSLDCTTKVENKKTCGSSKSSAIGGSKRLSKKCHVEVDDKTENSCDVICISDSESGSNLVELSDDRKCNSTDGDKRTSTQTESTTDSPNKCENKKIEGNRRVAAETAGSDIIASGITSVCKVGENAKQVNNSSTGRALLIKVYSAAISRKLAQNDDIIVSSDDSESESDESDELESEEETSVVQNETSETRDKTSSVQKETSKGQDETLKLQEEISKVQEKTSKRQKEVSVLQDETISPKCLEKESNSDLNSSSETSHKTPLKTTPSPKTPKSRKLTPRQLQKQLESAKKKEEKALLKQEREKKRAEEREERHKKEQQKKDQKRKEKEEKEEQKKKEREEKEKKRLAELELKNEEKKAKEEERRAKEEERKAKEEERRKREEQKLQEKKLKEQAEEDVKRRKEKEAAAFTSFFVPKKSEPKKLEQQLNTRRSFRPFMVKNDMRLATISRVNLSSNTKHDLEQALKEQSSTELYLQELKSGKITSRHDTQTWPLKDLQDEVMIIDDDMDGMDRDNLVMESHPPVNIPHPKLLQFHENRRPPYWGTWTKKSACIGPRRPFGKEEKLFDYDVDSDDEWEEEEPGESLNGSEDEKESEDEYEVDNDFFVPHGYLSDEENFGEEEEVLSPETMKAKLKLLAIEFEEERNQKTQRLKPGLIGCVWTSGNSATTKVGEQMKQFLAAWRAVYRSDGPIALSAPEEEASPKSPNSDARPLSSQSSVKRHKRMKFPDSALPDLVKLIHGNKNGKSFLLREFLAHWYKQHSLENEDGHEEAATDSTPVLSKKSILNKIKEIATWQQCPEEGAMQGQMCWFVSGDIRSDLGFSDLKVPNTWEYNLKPRRTVESDNVNLSATSSADTDSSHKTCPNSGQLITKFTKVLSDEERQKQLSPKASNSEPGQVSKTKRKIVFPAADSPSRLPTSRKKLAITGPPKSQSLVKFLNSPKSSTPSKRKHSSDVKSKNKTAEGESTDCIVID